MVLSPHQLAFSGTPVACNPTFFLWGSSAGTAGAAGRSSNNLAAMSFFCSSFHNIAVFVRIFARIIYLASHVQGFLSTWK